MLDSTSSHHESLSGGHLAFLRRVTEDDRFRTTLETDPQAAMAEYGLHVAPEQIPSEVRIPSAEGIMDILIDVEDDGQTDPDSARRAYWFGVVGN